MKEVSFYVAANRLIAPLTYKMILETYDQVEAKPGQFVNIEVPELFLRRPISICDLIKSHDSDYLCLIYKVVGKGTDALSHMSRKEKLNVLMPLGNGYDLSKAGDRPLLIGGGVGIPPLYYLARTLIEEGKKPSVIMGFNSKEEIFYADEFNDLGIDVHIATVDGSCGTKGYPTDIMKDLDYSYFYSCGPLPMLKAVHSASKTSGELSLEERMGCGFGACMGCSVEMLDLGSGESVASAEEEQKEPTLLSKRVCKDGPVFRKEELNW